MRSPTMEDIRNVYQAFANYLQIPTGTGRDEYYDFDMPDFLKKFKLSGFQPLLYSLKALEQEGWMSFNEQVFIPASINFRTTKEALYNFENSILNWNL